MIDPTFAFSRDIVIMGEIRGRYENDKKVIISNISQQKIYVVGFYYNRLGEAILIDTHNI